MAFSNDGKLKAMQVQKTQAFYAASNAGLHLKLAYQLIGSVLDRGIEVMDFFEWHYVQANFIATVY